MAEVSPFIMQTVFNIAVMAASFAFAEKMRNEMEKVEAKAVELAKRYFQADREKMDNYEDLMTLVDTEGEYDKCMTNVGQKRQELMDGQTQQHIRVASLSGKGMAGARRRIIRQAGAAISKELGGAYGEAFGFELLQEERAATDKLQADMARASTSHANVNLAGAMGILSGAYDNLGNIARRTFSATATAQGYLVNEQLSKTTDTSGQKQTDDAQSRTTTSIEYLPQAGDPILKSEVIPVTPTTESTNQQPEANVIDLVPRTNTNTNEG